MIIYLEFSKQFELLNVSEMYELILHNYTKNEDRKLNMF